MSSTSLPSTNVKNAVSLSLAWASAAFSFAIEHWSAVLSGLAALAALIASLYSIRINLIRLRREEIALDEEKREIKIKRNPPCDSP